MTYLSRLVPNPRSYAVRRDLADCYQMHRTVLAAFPDVEGSGREAFNVLYRIDVERGGAVLLVQSGSQPDWRRLPPGYLASHTCKDVDEQYSGIAEGQRVRFRLRANPTKRLGKSSGDSARRRVDLRAEEDQLAWLQRKGRAAGFDLVKVRASLGIGALGPIEAPDVRVTPADKVTGKCREGATAHRLTFGSVLFDGELRVADRNRFQVALRSGIGSGKAYGFGLLSIGPA